MHIQIRSSLLEEVCINRSKFSWMITEFALCRHKNYGLIEADDNVFLRKKDF